MLSVHCGTMLAHANSFKVFYINMCAYNIVFKLLCYLLFHFLKKVLLNHGYTVFLCDQVSF